jgi:Prp8 binding protein
MAEKRKFEDIDEDNEDAEEPTTSDGTGGTVALWERITKPKTELMVLKERKGDLIIKEGPTRTSGLLAPNMRLTGHDGAIYTCKFSPDGQNIASGSHDRLIFLWSTYGECNNWGVLKGHSGAVLDLQWQRDGERLYSASSDKSAAIWDVETCTRIKKLRDHKSHVNSVDSAKHGDPFLVTGSDDCYAMMWDARVRGAVHRFQSSFAVTSVAFSTDSLMVYSAGLDEKISAWDVRQGQVLYELLGHTDTVSGLRVSPDGTRLLSNAFDNTLRMWDIRPFVSGQLSNRFLGNFVGAQHDFQKSLLKCSWSKDGSRVSAGSSDNFVHVWDVNSKQMLYKLPGHTGAVMEVDFHPSEPIIVSASQDKTMFVGEISSH